MKFIGIWILNPLKTSGGQPVALKGLRCLAWRLFFGGNCVAEIEGDTAPEEHPPRMHWELLLSVPGQNAKAHLGANLHRIWDESTLFSIASTFRVTRTRPVPTTTVRTWCCSCASGTAPWD